MLKKICTVTGMPGTKCAMTDMPKMMRALRVEVHEQASDEDV
jgi:hypothetical protein